MPHSRLRAPRLCARRFVAPAAGLAFAVAIAPAARAQGGAISSQCAVSGLAGSAATAALVAQDACQKSVDLFNYLAPQLGALVAGGNAEPGQGGTTGGRGHFGVSLRVNATRSPLPQFDRVSVRATGADASFIPARRTLLAFPAADLAVGLFGGVPVGVTRVGGLDLLVNATYLPNVDQSQARVRTDGGSVRLGVGARLGLVAETALVPGVSVSVLRRGTPTASITANSGDDSVGVSDTRVRADSWRLTASKRLLVVSLAAGVGQDRYRSEARVSGVVNETVLGQGVRATSSVDLTQTLTRTNVFGNLTLFALPFARVVGEVGRSSGGTLAATYNSIDGRRPDAAYTYASVGVRLGR